MSDMAAEQARDQQSHDEYRAGQERGDFDLDRPTEVWQAGYKAGMSRALTAPRVPEGWALVPIEPTEQMMNQAADNLCGEFGIDFVAPKEGFARAVYRELLDAAPITSPRPESDEVLRLRERVAELEAALEPDMFWWADDPEHPAADDLDGLCDMIFDDSLSPSDGVQLAKVRLAASLPDAVLEAKLVDRDGDFYWESRLREGGEL